jgi:hypothetical protein
MSPQSRDAVLPHDIAVPSRQRRGDREGAVRQLVIPEGGKCHAGVCDADGVAAFARLEERRQEDPPGLGHGHLMVSRGITAA